MLDLAGRSALHGALVCLVLSLSFLVGCGGSESESGGGSAEGNDEEKLSPQEMAYRDAGKPFLDALASRNYAAAFGALSSHAKARMSLNQFDPSDDDTAFAKREQEPRKNVSAADFATLMATAEARFGKPVAVLDINVFETDADILSGKPKDKLDRLAVMFAIGNMPADIPANIRKASLRTRIRTELSADQLAEAAKAYRTTPEKLKQDPDFVPSFMIKTVLVEEGGGLRVGYFEMLPPGMFDD